MIFYVPTINNACDNKINTSVTFETWIQRKVMARNKGHVINSNIIVAARCVRYTRNARYIH